jgi:hypothetical protein
MPDFGALRHGSQVDVLTAMNDRDSTCPCGCLALFVLFPCTFFIANFDAGWPTIIAVHLVHTSTPAIAAAAVLSICFAILLVRAGRVVPAAAISRRCRGSCEPPG